MPSTLKISIQSSSRAAIAIATATAHRIYTIVVSYVGNVSVMLTLFCCFILFTAFNGWSMMFPPTPFEHQCHSNAAKQKTKHDGYQTTCTIASEVLFVSVNKQTHGRNERELKSHTMIE